MIKSFEDFIQDFEINESSLDTIDILEILVEMSKENELEISEGWSFGTRGRKGDRKFKFVGGKNDTDATSTEIFDENGKFKAESLFVHSSSRYFADDGINIMKFFYLKVE